jgi:hypothetical protein
VGQLHRTRAAPFNRKWLAHNFVVTTTLSFGEWLEHVRRSEESEFEPY